MARFFGRASLVLTALTILLDIALQVTRTYKDTRKAWNSFSATPA